MKSCDYENSFMKDMEILEIKIPSCSFSSIKIILSLFNGFIILKDVRIFFSDNRKITVCYNEEVLVIAPNIESFITEFFMTYIDNNSWLKEYAEMRWKQVDERHEKYNKK